VGGLLIWGVDARPGEEGIDCAQDVAPISSIKKFASEVSGLLTDYLMPPNEAIKLQDIPSDRLEGGGYLIVLVEPSELRPHMSMAPDHHRYYRRSGGRFVAMEHYEIQDMFNRIAPVRLEVFHRHASSYRKVNTATIMFGVRNDTRLTGKFPYVRVKNLSGGAGPMRAPGFGLKRKLVTLDSRLFAGDINDAVHPGQELEVFIVEIKVPTGSNDLPNYPVPEIVSRLQLDLQVGCENSEMREVKIDLSPQEICDLFN
jgi:hypothetical protein